MAFHQLSSKNFRLSSGSKRTLDIDVGGKILLFIKMDGCPGCSSFYPIFQELSKLDKRVNYVIFDITNPSNKQVVAMSRESTTPIESVPLILIYNDGSPVAKYKGKKTFEGVQGFITAILKVIESAPSKPQQRSFMQDTPSQYNYSTYNQPSESKVYMPETGSSAQSKYQKQNTNLSEIDDDEDYLLVPDEITPYNTPWKSDYKKMSID